MRKTSKLDGHRKRIANGSCTWEPIICSRSYKGKIESGDPGVIALPATSTTISSPTCYNNLKQGQHNQRYARHPSNDPNLFFLFLLLFFRSHIVIETLVCLHAPMTERLYSRGQNVLRWTVGRRISKPALPPLNSPSGWDHQNCRKYWWLILVDRQFLTPVSTTFCLCNGGVCGQTY